MNFFFNKKLGVHIKNNANRKTSNWYFIFFIIIFTDKNYNIIVIIFYRISPSTSLDKYNLVPLYNFGVYMDSNVQPNHLPFELYNLVERVAMQ